MDASDPTFEPSRPHRLHEREARLLVDSLRASRVTLLYAAAGASRGALLRESVVPLLARREADLSAERFLESRVVAPFVDRREASKESAQGERAVLFSQWGGDPLAALLAVLRTRYPDVHDLAAHASLVDTVWSICAHHGGRLLIVLDAVEELWTTGIDASATAAFFGALKEVVSHPGLPVNLLLAVDARCESQLEALCRDIPRFDDSTVRLLGLENTAAPVLPEDRTLATPQRAARGTDLPAATAGLPTLSDAVSSPQVQPPALPAARSHRKKARKVPLPAPVPIQTDGVYAFIESTLAVTADASEPWHETGPQFVGVDAARGRSVAPGDLGPAQRVDPGRQEHHRSGRLGSPAAALGRPGGPAPAEPPSPIDEWLDGAIAWCRRLLRRR